DGLAVVSSSTHQIVTDPNAPIQRVEENFGPGQANLTVNSVWDTTDLTYVVRGSIILAGDYYNRFGSDGEEALHDPNIFVEERKPRITLTVQSALPDTVLADGSKIGRPGESALVKLMSDYDPWSSGLIQDGARGATNND